MFINKTISDLKNLIISNNHKITNCEEKILKLKNQNMIYQKYINSKQNMKAIKILKIVKDKEWNETTIHLSVIDINEAELNEINIYSNCRLSWKQRGSITKIIKQYYEKYPDIEKIISFGYPLSQDIKNSYTVIFIEDQEG